MDKFLHTFAEFSYAQLALVDLGLMDARGAVCAIKAYVTGMNDVLYWDGDEKVLEIIRQAEERLLEKIRSRGGVLPQTVSLKHPKVIEAIDRVRAAFELQIAGAHIES